MYPVDLLAPAHGAAEVREHRHRQLVPRLQPVRHALGLKRGRGLGSIFQHSSTSAVKLFIGSTIGFHNYGEGLLALSHLRHYA